MSTTGKFYGVQTLDDIRARCRIDDESGCWVWTGAFSDRRTPTVSLSPGVLRERRFTMSAIRAAFLLAGRRVTAGQLVYRTPLCPTAACCNPEHHKAGTAQDASRAAVQRGTYKTVQRNALLQTNRLRQAVHIDKVRAIEAFLREGNPATLASAQFGVCVDTCREIARGRHFHQRRLECKNASVFSWRPQP